MSSTNTLQVLDEHGWRRGFRNMLRKENGDWWQTKSWWMSSLVWTLIMNGILFLLLWIVPIFDPEDAPVGADAIEMGLEVFFTFFSFAVPIGMMVLVQGAIIREKDAGTAAWTMSKPVSRSAFILSKLVAHSLGALIVIFLLQSVVFYAQMWLKAGPISIGPLVSALSLMALNALFYLALGLMLGTFFSSRSPVIGVSLGLLLGQLIFTGMLEGLLPWLPLVEPKTVGDLAGMVAQERVLPPEWPIPVILTTLYITVSIALAIWRFHREEF